MAFRKELKFWGLSLLLYLPFLLYYIYYAFCFSCSVHTPAGFISLDDMMQMSQAREYVEPGFRLTAGNPASPLYGAPRIYVQPLLLCAGVFWKLTGLDAAVVWLIFGFLTALVCSRIAIALYQEVVGLEGTAAKTGLLVFFWGGGVIALLGGLSALLHGKVITHESLFAMEPLQGMWPLNFGRHLLSPVQAYLHGLFFATMLCVLRKRYEWAVFLVFLTALSDIYTGTQVLSIAVAWGIFEKYFMRSDEVPSWFTGALVALGIIQFSYYFIFLGSFDEHRQVMIQGAAALMHARNSLPAWLLVGLLFFSTFRTIDHACQEFERPSMRLLLTWLFISLLWAHNQFAFTPPLCPLQFAQGYIWTALFFLGSPALMALINFILERKGTLVRYAGLILLLFLFFLDTTLWLTTRRRGGEQFFQVSMQERDMLRWMNGMEAAGKTVVSPDIPLNCHVVLYTPLRAWASYPFYTPFYEKRVKELQAFFQSGTRAAEWQSMPLVVIVDREFAGEGPPPQWIALSGSRPLFRNTRYTVYVLNSLEGAGKNE